MPIGNHPEAALKALQLKRLELTFVAAGGEIKQPDKKKDLELAYLAAGGQINQENLETAQLTTGYQIKQDSDLSTERPLRTLIPDAVKS